MIVEAVVEADSHLSGSWSLHNSGGAATEVAIAAVAYEDYSRGRRFAPPPAWLSLGADTLILAPGEETSVAFTIRLPAAAVGESLALVFFAERARGAGATMQGRLGTALYALAAGTARPDLRLASTHASQDAAGTILGVSVANAGNVHLRPKGILEVLGRTGRVRARCVLRTGAPVLPGQVERFFAAPIHPPLPPGRWRLRWTIDPGLVDGRAGPVIAGDTALNVPR